MQSTPNLLTNPNDLPVNVLEAIKKATYRMYRLDRLKMHAQANREYLARIKSELGNVKPAIRKTVSRPTKVIRSVITYSKPVSREPTRSKAKRIRRELLDAGATMYGLLKSESRYLPKILHDNEHIEAVIYGQHNSNSAMLVATDERIIYLDKKPMVELFDEVSYEVVSGIEFDIHLIFARVILHTPVKNYDFRFVNLRCGDKFARHIESQRLEREDHERSKTEAEPPPPNPEEVGLVDEHQLEDMAGYYWLPSDEDERRRLQQIGI